MLISRYEMFKAVYFHKTVRFAEVMLLNSMILADEQLNLTDTSLDNYLNLTDESYSRTHLFAKDWERKCNQTSSRL